MKTIIKSILIITFAIFFLACEDNTENPVIKDITSIQIEDGNISIYSTDEPKTLTATATYTDGSTAQIFDANIWSNSNYDSLTMHNGIIIPASNGGYSTVKISNEQFSDEINVSIIKIVDFNITNADINTTGEHILEATGKFEDNVSKIIKSNISWDADNEATIETDENYVTTITILSGDTNVTATVFEDDNETNITKSVIYSIN